MNEQYIEDNQIMERYLSGRLSEVETRHYETYYIEHPEHLERLQATEEMLAGFRGVAAQETAKLGITTLLARLLSNKGPQLALLLVIPLVILSSWSYQLNQELKSVRKDLAYQLQPRANTPIYELTAKRSAGEVRPVTLPPGVDLAVLVLNLELADETRCRVSLSDGAELLWQGDHFSPDYRGALRLSLPVTMLPQGPVSLVVSDGHGELARFNLQFLQPGI